MVAVTFKDLSTAQGIQELNAYLLQRSYITGYQASRDDLSVFSALPGVPSAESAPNIARWYKHIQALLGSNFPGEGAGVSVGSGATPSGATAAAPSSQAPAAAPAAADDDDDDDDLDLFGGQSEEEKKAAADREAANAKAGKKKESGKSSVLLDVKPWDDETDMAKLEAAVRKVQMDGLNFGASKLQEVGYGIKKLTIMLTIVDDLVSLDELIEDKLTAEGTECAEFIQSCDIVAFNKI